MLALSLFAAACGTSRIDTVCDNIGACSHGGDTDWIEGCESAANVQQEQAKIAGCTQFFDRYYECADDNYVCNGASARFPHCDSAAAAIASCLQHASMPSACATLAERRSACVEIPDGGDVQFIGETAGMGVCNLQRECVARCYLGQIERVCAPKIDELAAFSDCSSKCW